MAVTTRPRGDVQINLLPEQMQSAQRARGVFRWAVSGAVVLMVLLGAFTVAQRMQISSTERTLRTERAAAESLRSRVADLRGFEVLQGSIDQARMTLAGVLTGDLSWSRLLDDLDTVMPPDAWLTSLSMSAGATQTPMGVPSVGTVDYQGFVTTFPGLSGWLDTIDGLDGQTFVYLSNGQKQDVGGSKVVSFTASAHITESLLSQRCQREGAPCP